MLSYEELCQHPNVFPALTGLTHTEFDHLLVRFCQAEDELRQQATHTPDGQPRQRAPGGGRHAKLSDANRLFLALLWLRLYPTYEVLGFFFHLHKRNAQLQVRAVLGVLEQLADWPFQRPGPERPKLRSPAEVIAAFPAVRFFVDATEQRTNKPHGETQQKPYYSGKKKTHTLKNQYVVDPCGRILDVSDSVPGATHDLEILKTSGVLPRLKNLGSGMADKGYVGIGKHEPDVEFILPHKKPRGGSLTAEQLSHNRAVARVRVVVEHTLAQVKRFTVLRQVFRGKKRQRHSQIVRVVAQLVNERLAVKPLKTYAA